MSSSSETEEKTNQIGVSLNMPTSNSPTALIAELADVNGLRAAKIKAFAESLEANTYVDDITSEQGSFYVTHKGKEFNVCEVDHNCSGTDFYTLHEKSQMLWGQDDVCCKVISAAVCVQMRHNYYFMGESFEDLATKIIDLMDDERCCELCGALFEGMEGFCICQRCALSELPEPCATCGKKHGRDVHSHTEEAPEHTMCKKRRLNAY